MKTSRIMIHVLPFLFLAISSLTAGTLRYTIVGQEEYSYQTVLTEFYLVEVWEDEMYVDSSLVRIDGDYLVFYGDIIAGVPVFESEPAIVEKVFNITPPDSWVSNLGDSPTIQMAVGMVQKTVPAGTFSAMELNTFDFDVPTFYLGKRWYAEEVGLLGFEMEYLGVTEYQRLTSYTYVGGSGYWPLAVGNETVFETGQTMTVVDAPYASITIDGDPTDWASYAPAIEDPEGDDPSIFDGVDIKELFIANDDVNLYLMISFWDSGPTPAWGGSRDDAYMVYVMPDDDDVIEIVNISYQEPGGWYITTDEFSSFGTSIACSDVIELSIPLANLGHPSSLFRYSLSVGDMGDGYDLSNMVGVNLATASEGCCGLYNAGLTGNNNCSTDGKLTLGDITTLIDYVYISKAPLCCQANANSNGSSDCKITLGDITGLIDAVYISKAPPAECMPECEQ